TDELAHDLVPWGWLVLFVGPPLLAWLWRRRRPAAPMRVVVAAPAPLSRIGRAEREFHALLASHVPDAEARDGDGLGRALGAEALYEAGALRAAADSFAARAAAQPRVPAHWYNLGATLYRAGADGKASAAWAIAARLAPRDETVRRARELLPPPDAPSEPLFVVGFATPGEWALVAAVLWSAMWMVAAGGRRRVVLATVALATAATVGLGVREALRRGQPIAIVVHPATSVRVAPYG